MKSDNYLNTEFSSILEEMEGIRKNEFRKFILKSILLFIVLPVILLAVFWQLCFLYDKDLIVFMSSIFLSPWILLVYIALYGWFCHVQNKKFSSLLKENYISSYLSNFGKIRWYGHDRDKKTLHYSDNNLKQSGLFLDFNTRYKDDEFKGVYNDVEFSISETRLHNIHDTGKHKYNIKVFEGVIIEFKSNKEIKNRTIISTKWNLTQKSQRMIALILFTLPLFSIFSDMFILNKILVAVTSLILLYITLFLWKDKKSFDNVTLEDPKFMKRFNVYSSDQVEARYLITTSFMQRFMDLKTSFGARTIKCSFFNDNLMIAITTSKNLFEIGTLFRPINKNSIKKFFNELESILNMIEYFKLDEKTGL